MANMDFGVSFHDVNPVGGKEKADAVRNAADRVGLDLSDIMYVGDSITDVEAFKLIKMNNGLAMSFNGNRYAINEVEIAAYSEDSIVTAIIADVFCRFGKQKVLNLIENWSRDEFKKYHVNQALLNLLFQFYIEKIPKVKIITSENMDGLSDQSSKFRNKFRGRTIGSLG